MKVTEDGLEKWAARLAGCLTAGDFVLLEGPLGAGKTTLARCLLMALGHPEDEVSSPTFTLLHEHPGNPPAIHADLYRLNTSQELVELGLVPMAQGAVALVEWGWRFPELRELGDLLLRLDFDDGAPLARQLALDPLSDRGKALLAAFDEAPSAPYL